MKKRSSKFMILLLAAVLALSAFAYRRYTDPYAGYKELMRRVCADDLSDINRDWLQECLFHCQIQPDGHGLAMLLHPVGLDASGRTPVVMLETGNGGKSWDVLHERYDLVRGGRAFVYMGETAVILANSSKGDGGSAVFSYDRGRTWTGTVCFDELMDYDVEVWPDLEPHVLNYNADTGIITMGWKALWGNEDYLLINQLDVYSRQIIEEIYRSPEFTT